MLGLLLIFMLILGLGAAIGPVRRAGYIPGWGPWRSRRRYRHLP